jgi:hypothetical protein
MLGKLNAGPAKSSASAGPFHIPLPIKPCRIGTSVNVAKDISALSINKNQRIAPMELLPRAV